MSADCWREAVEVERARASPRSEAEAPEGTTSISLGDRDLPTVPDRLDRIAVIGDTGCRLNGGDGLDDGFQACNDPEAWAFPLLAEQIATWEPDLVISVGDFIYREEPCDVDTQPDCAGSPWNSAGQHVDTWVADFFAPAEPMLTAAPLVVSRGNHERCARAGRGYFRFLDVHDFTGGCTDFSPPYVAEFENLQLAMMDFVQAPEDDGDQVADVVGEVYRRDLDMLADLDDRNSWLVTHYPVWALEPVEDDDTGQLALSPLNAGVQQALRDSSLAGALPDQVSRVVSGHIHLAGVLSFDDDRPPQLVAGSGGTLEVPTVGGADGTELDGATVTESFMLSEHGYVQFETAGGETWSTTFVDGSGDALATCERTGGQDAETTGNQVACEPA